jgi:hypothetical protein
MKKQIGPYTFEISNCLITITETSSRTLLKAVEYSSYEAVDKFHAICAHWEKKMKSTVA